jgi:ABC-type branched-subunit amino acid transport system substrate-binding protein
MRSRRLTSLVLLVFVCAACGARLTEQQRAAGIGALARGGTGNGQPGSVVPGSTVGPTGSAVPGATTTGGPAGPGQTGGPQAASCSGAGAGVTDKGVTANQITIATISNISGVQPGLFKATHQAIQALALYVNTQGGICGRQLKPQLIDDKTDSTQNRAATLQACQSAFALVGSMSAFDDGGADVVHSCGIPDITAITTTPDRALEPNTLAAYPNRPDYVIGGPAVYIKKTFPDVIKHAAILWLDATVTRVNAQQRKKAYEKVWGTKYAYTAAIPIVTANYDSYVQAMKSKGIQYVDMVSDYQSIVRLSKAMKQQGFNPKVRDWDSVVYAKGFLDLAQGSANDSLFFINTSMLEEVNQNPEMQLYEQWLQRAAPGAKPDYFGLYAWSAGRLFAELATAIGPKLTRKAMFDKLRATHSWGDHGLHAPHDVGDKKAAPCFLYGIVKTDQFQRHYPSSSWDCKSGTLVKVPL